MPPRKNYVCFFTTMTLAVEKKINQLMGYIRQLAPTTVGEMQERMLMDLTSKLREAIDHQQLTWMNKRDKILQPHLSSVAETIATGEAALRKAERFVVLGNNGRSQPRTTPDSPSARPDCLDNTLKLARGTT